VTYEQYRQLLGLDSLPAVKPRTTSRFRSPRDDEAAIIADMRKEPQKYAKELAEWDSSESK
jgi:hypothetical protein